MPEKETEVHYFAVECEEQKGWIQLLRVRDVGGKLHLNWPGNLPQDSPANLGVAFPQHLSPLGVESTPSVPHIQLPNNELLFLSLAWHFTSNHSKADRSRRAIRCLIAFAEF